MRTGKYPSANISGASLWCVVAGILLGTATPALVGEGWWFFAIVTALAAGALLIWGVRVPAGVLLIVSVALAAQIVLALLTKHDDLTRSRGYESKKNYRTDV